MANSGSRQVVTPSTPLAKVRRWPTPTFEVRDTDNGGSSQKGKKAKTSTYWVKHVCMICGTRTTQYCSTCYPMGSKEGAVCRGDCLRKHATRVLLGL